MLLFLLIINKGKRSTSDDEIRNQAAENAKVVMEGLVNMKKNIFMNQTRRLVVTNEPSIRFFNVKNGQEKGKVDVKSITHIKVTKANTFFIEAAKKTYEFMTDNPDAWVEAISHVIDK